MKIDIKKVNTLTTETIMLLSACIDKMDIAEELKNLEINTGDSNKDNEELGKQLIILIITKMHRAKEEFYELIANFKNITVEEAKKLNIIPVVQEILGIEGTVDFLS